MPSDYDGAWKDLLHARFLEALTCYFPEVAEAIDPASEPEFLDQELRELKIDPQAVDNRVDLLVRVGMRDGRSGLLYLHLEVQSFREEGSFSGLMSTPEPGHDQLFRHALSIPAVVRQFLSAWLPREFLAMVDWSSLQIEKIGGINPALTERREDLVYRVDVADCSVCFYLLLEHQSRPDPLMPLRVLEYITLVWQKHRKDREQSIPRRLPVVIPVVLYPGPGRWQSPRRLRDLMEVPSAVSDWVDSFCPDCGFCLIELSDLPMERLADGPTARAILSALQSQRKGDLDADGVARIVAELFADHDRSTALQTANHLWTYLLHHSELQSNQINQIIETVVPLETRTDFMSTAELLRQEGIEQGIERGIEQGIERGIEQGIERGIEQGLEQGVRNSILSILKRRLGPVPGSLVEAIHSIHDLERLETLLHTAVTASSFEDLASHL